MPTLDQHLFYHDISVRQRLRQRTSLYHLTKAAAIKLRNVTSNKLDGVVLNEYIGLHYLSIDPNINVREYITSSRGPIIISLVDRAMVLTQLNSMVSKSGTHPTTSEERQIHGALGRTSNIYAPIALLSVGALTYLNLVCVVEEST